VTANDSDRPIPRTGPGDPDPEVITTVTGLRARLDRCRARGRSIGFVPTMGYLHAGHGSLMARAADECDTTVASVFVNPLQFGPGEDLDTYPRDPDHDRAVAAASGVGLLFVPSTEEMYPRGEVATMVTVDGLSASLEGASRPGHFAGVATVVTKLLSIVGPCRAYFGEKDFQQLAVVRRMVADLSLGAEIIGCPIVREPDGLAMSSRNVRLQGPDRSAAAVLDRALRAGADAITAGERSGPAVEAVMARVVAGEERAELDYAVAADPHTLDRPRRLDGEVRLLIAARVGPVRLIDNRGVPIDPAQVTR
jgi:pantoate--beta-alanine ligase